MAGALEIVNATIDATTVYQAIDGFGVNINSKYWDHGGLLPVMEMLTEDLGATLFRVDIAGDSRWLDPEGRLDASTALTGGACERAYTGRMFRDGWVMMKYLNAKGIQPYLTCSGVVPKWMCADDGRTLSEYGLFCDMMVSLVDWARRKEGIDFRLFGPLNETDLGPPEGPAMSPQAFAEVIGILDSKLSAAGLDDIRLVVAEQGRFNPDFLAALACRESLAHRIACFGMHTYYTQGNEAYAGLRQAVQGTVYESHPFWMTEYGDLDQSGEREWYIAWVSAQRLLGCLANGFSGAMAWDAYDNYHDHDEAWTIYGLIRNARRVYTPKKRYFAAKQVYRFVRPGFERVALDMPGAGITALAFADSQRKRFTVTGINDTGRSVFINLKLAGLEGSGASGPVAYYRTTETENCVLVGTLSANGLNWPFDGYVAELPPHSIFTITNV